MLIKQAVCLFSPSFILVGVLRDHRPLAVRKTNVYGSAIVNSKEMCIGISFFLITDVFCLYIILTFIKDSFIDHPPMRDCRMLITSYICMINV